MKIETIQAAKEFKRRFPETWDLFSDEQKKHVVYAMNGWSVSVNEELADRLEQQPISEEKTTLPQLRDKCITGTFQIGATGIKEPPSWEFHAKKLELMILNGEFNHPQPISDEKLYNQAVQIILDYTASSHWKDVKKIKWLTMDVVEVVKLTLKKTRL